MNNVEIKFYLDHEKAEMPYYETAGSAGMDIRSIQNYTIEPGNRELIRTGLHCSVPKGYQFEVRPRSGLAFRHGISIVNSPGTVDEDYRGEICVILINHGKDNFIVNAGDRIAQLVLGRVIIHQTIQVDTIDDLGTTGRDQGGFGSTGK